MFWHRNYGFWEKGHAAKSESANNEPLIYNLQGEEISRLVERLHSAGVYSVAWNASNVSSGIYFYPPPSRRYGPYEEDWCCWDSIISKT